MKLKWKSPTLYVKNDTTKTKLWSNQIMIWPDKEYNFDWMKERLEGFVNYLIKQKNDEWLSNIYKSLIGKNCETEKLEDLRDDIFIMIKDLTDKKDVQWMKKVHKWMLWIWSYKKNASDIKIEDTTFYNLNDFSKKKYLLYKLKEKHPELDKKWIKDLIKEIKVLWNNDDILSLANDIWMDSLYYNIWIYFNDSSVSDVDNLLIYWNLEDADAKTLVKLFEKSSKVSPKTIEKFEEEFYLSKEIKPDITSHSTDDIEWTTISDIKNILNIERKQIADFNPFLFELNFEVWIKELWLERFIEVYSTLFSDISYEILDQIKWIKPSFNAFRKFESSKLNIDLKDKEKSFVYQYLIEFPVSEDFDIKKLKDLAVLLNKEVWWVNLMSPEKNKPFKHPLSTIKWNTTYTWYFWESGEKFLDSNIIIQKWENWEKIVRLTLSRFSQDEYIYLISQIWYYIKNWTFVDKNQLYFDLYDRYNKTLFSSELFDITVLKDKYESFVRDLIIPLSKEWLELWLKADNTLLAWLYWTSKSQFLMHLLLDKKWILNDREFFLNATTIPIGLQEFKALLMQWIWWIKTRLDQIFSRTQAPIILIVEDLDTLVNEKITWANDEIAQAMTIFFEGLWSLPVTVVTTSNDPTKFSERLIRPNRLSKIKIFNRPTIEEKKIMIKNHLNLKTINLTKKNKKTIYESNVFKEWTASHIWEIVKEIFNYLKIEKEIFWKDVKLSNDRIKEILNWITISVSDINEKENMINDWYDEISGKEPGKKMWFKPE